MTKLVSRPLLGICAICAIVGGAALVTMVVVYFGASRYVPEFQIGGYGLLIGVVGLGLYVGGAIPIAVVGRVAAGAAAAVASFVVTVIVAFLISLAADPGGPRGNLEDGAAGAIWFLIGGFLAWQAARGSWPATRNDSRHP